MDNFEQFYPSEVARLVLGYLDDINCLYAWEIFLVECSDLREHYTHYSQGRKHSTKVNGKSLHDILSEYCKLKYQVTSEQTSPSQVDPTVFNEESAEKITERKNSDTSNLPSFVTPSYKGIVVLKKVNLTSTPQNVVTEVRSENVAAASKVSPAHDSTKLSVGANAGHINTETSKSCASDTPTSVKGQQCCKHKSLLKEKHCCHKITQTDVLPVRDTNVQTELKLLYTNFRQHMAIASVHSIREEEALKSVDCDEFRQPDFDSQVASIFSDVTEENCIAVPLNKRKGFVPKKLLIDSVVHDTVEKQTKVNLKEILKDMVILEEFLSYQPVVKSICDNINRAICEDSEGSNSLTNCSSLQKVAKEKIIKSALDKTKSDPLLHLYLSFIYCRKDFQIGKLKHASPVINTDNQVNISTESNCTETYFSHTTSFIEAPQTNSSNVCLEKNANIESVVNISSKQIFENLEKICTLDIVFNDETTGVDDCSTENNIPSVKVQDCKNTSPMNLMSLVENSSTLNSVLNIKNNAPMNSVVSVENTAPMVSVMPIQTIASSDSMMSIDSIANFREGEFKPAPIGAPFTSIFLPTNQNICDNVSNLTDSIFLSTNQNICGNISNLTTDSIFLPTNQNICDNISNFTTDSIFLPTNQNICGNNVIVGNASNNISNLVIPNNSIFPQVNLTSSPQFPISGLSNVFVPSSSSYAFPLQNSIQYSLIINPNINWNCSSSNDVRFHAQTVIKDNSLQNQLVNNNTTNLGSEEGKSCIVEGQPEDERTVDVISIKKVALKKKNTNSIKSRVASIQKKTIPKTLNVKAINSSSPPILKRKYYEELQNKKSRPLLPLPTATEGSKTIKRSVVSLTSEAAYTREFCNESADTNCGIDNLSTEIEVADMQIPPLKSLLSAASLLAAKNAEAYSVFTQSLDFFGNAERNEACPGNQNINSECSQEVNKMSSSSLTSNKIAHQSSTKPISCNKALNKSIRKKVTNKDSDIVTLTPEEIVLVSSSKVALDKKVSKNVSSKPQKKKAKKENVDTHINDKSKPDLPESFDSQLSLPTSMVVEVLNAMQKAIDMKSSRVLECNNQKFSSMKSEIFDISNIENEDIFEVGHLVPSTNIVLRPKAEMNETMDLDEINSELHISNEAQDLASKDETLDNVCAFIKAEDFENSRHISSSNSGLGSNMFLEKPESSAPSTLDSSLGETENCLLIGKNISVNLLESSNNNEAQVNESIKINALETVKVVSKKAVQPSKKNKKESKSPEKSKKKLIPSENCLFIKNISKQKNVDLLESSNNNEAQVNEVIKRNSSKKEVRVVLEKAAQHSKKNMKESKCPEKSKKTLIPSGSITNVLKSKQFLSNTQSSSLEKSSVVEKGNKITITHKYPLRAYSHKKNTQNDFQLDSESDEVNKQCDQKDKIVEFLGLTGKSENELDKQKMHPEEAHVNSFSEQMSQSLLVSSDSTIKAFVVNTNEISSPELFIDEIGTCQETEDKDAIKYDSPDQSKTINRQVPLDCATDCQPFLKKLTVTIERMNSETITKAMFPNQVTNLDIGNLPSPFCTNPDMKRASKRKENKTHNSTINKHISAPAKKRKLLTSKLPRCSISRSKGKTKAKDFLSGNKLDDVPIQNKPKESIAFSFNENSMKSDLISPLKTFPVVQLEQDKVIKLDSSDTSGTNNVLKKNKSDEPIACSVNEKSMKSNLINPLKKFPVVLLEHKVMQLDSSNTFRTGDVLILNKPEESIACSVDEKSMKSDLISPLKQFPEIELELEPDIIPSSLIATDECLHSNKIMLAKLHKKVPYNDTTLVDISSEEQILIRAELEIQQIQGKSLETFSAKEMLLNQDIVPSTSIEIKKISPSKTVIFADSHKKDSEIDLVKTCISSEVHIIGDKVSKAQQIIKKSSGEIQPLLSGEDTLLEVKNQLSVSTVFIENEISNSNPAVCKKRKLFNPFTESKEHTIDRLCASDEKEISSSSHTSNQPNKTFFKSVLKKIPGRHFNIPSCVKSYEEWKADNSTLTKIRRSKPALKIFSFQTPEKENGTMLVSNTKVSNRKLKEMSSSTCMSEIPSQVDSKLCHFQQNVMKFGSQQDLPAGDINFQTISSEKSVNLGHEKVSSSKHLTLSTQNQCHPEKVNNIQLLNKEAVKRDTKKEAVVIAKNEFIKNNIDSGVENQTSLCDKLNQGSEKNCLLEELPSSNILIPRTENKKESVELIILEKCDEHIKQNSNNLTVLNTLSADKSSKLKSSTSEEIPLPDASSLKENKLDEQIICSDPNIITEGSDALAASTNDIKSVSCDKKLCIENNELKSPNLLIEDKEDIPLADPKSTKTETEAQNRDVARRNKITLNSSKFNSEELLSALSAEMVKSIKDVNPEVLMEQMREYGLDNLLNLLSEKE